MLVLWDIAAEGDSTSDGYTFAQEDLRNPQFPSDWLTRWKRSKQLEKTDPRGWFVVRELRTWKRNDDVVTIDLGDCMIDIDCSAT